MKAIVLIFPMLVLAVIVRAQQPLASIAGKLKDGRSEPVAGAIIRLYLVKDSQFVKQELSQADGSFLFRELSADTYFIAISSLAQKPYASGIISLDSVHLKLEMPVIFLEPAVDKEMEAVVVRSKKPLLEHALDKTVVNVDAMISSSSSNTLEVLGKTPGVTVSSNGDISLNGRGSVLGLIDGRSMYMSAGDLATYLKALPGSSVDKIELIDNPSARYDAAGNAIINIRLKKNRVGGFTGSVSKGYSQGRYARHNDGLQLNYNTRRVVVFSNIGHGYDKGYTTERFDRRFFTETGGLNSTVTLNNHYVGSGHSMNYVLGLDYTANARTTIGTSFNLNTGKRLGQQNSASAGYDALHQRVNIALSTTGSTDRRTNLGANLNLLHKFRKEGSELTADISYLRYRARGRQDLSNALYDVGGNLANESLFSYHVPSGIRILTWKADYLRALSGKAKLEAGYKTSIVRNDNVFEYYDEDGPVPVIDHSRSNDFRYREQISAIYANGQKSWGRVGLQIGLRMEHTSLQGKQAGNLAVHDSSFSRSYAAFFPSVFWSYKLDSAGTRNLGLAIMRRINRPNYHSLNPFLFFRDNYSYAAGNPFLRPQFQYRLELKYQHKQWLSVGLSYNRFTSIIFQITEAVDDKFITRPGNVAKGYMYLLNTGVNFSPVKWWYLNAMLRLSQMGLNGMAYTEILNPSTNVTRFELNNYFTLSPTINAELGGYFASADLNGQAYTKPMYRMQLGIQKKIAKDKGSIRFSVDDLLHSWKYRNNSVGLRQAEFYQTSESDTQRIGLAFTWRFGKKAFARKRNHTDNAADEEKGRIN